MVLDGLPKCLASTGDDFNEPISRTVSHYSKENNCFRHAALSSDGTTIVTYNEDQRLRSFILPPSLLSEDDDPTLALTPYSTSTPQQSNTFTLYPHFALSNPATTLLLQSRTDLPITLLNALDVSYRHASYPFINPTTEAYIPPHSLLFTPYGDHFIAGSKETIAIFDTSRDGQGPVRTSPTRQSRKTRQSYSEMGNGLNGLVTALSICPATSRLAAGSTGGRVAVFDHAGDSLNEAMGFEVAAGESRSGNGVMQVEWDGSGTYLFVAERQSDVLSTFDVRMGRSLNVLKNRRAMTTQRLGFEVVEAAGNVCIWAGGTDGCLRTWKAVTSIGGEVDPDTTIKLHNDALSNVLRHPEGEVFATTSGSRRDVQSLADDRALGEDSDDGRKRDTSLKVWATTM